jgi:5-methylcytosine-specific restriction endonuclease McrA
VSFFRSPALIRSRRTYCSMRCKGLASRDPDASTRYTGRYVDWRNAVLARDNFTCTACKRKTEMLHAHHLKGWASHPEWRFDVSNGVTLCEACHAGEHPWMRRRFE